MLVVIGCAALVNLCNQNKHQFTLLERNSYEHKDNMCNVYNTEEAFHVLCLLLLHTN